MNYPVEQLENDISDIITETAVLRKAKGHDYSSGDSDTFENLRDFGWKGIVVRIGDKYHRLKAFTVKEKLAVSDETILDTINDLINYSLYVLILYRQEKKNEQRK